MNNRIAIIIPVKNEETGLEILLYQIIRQISPNDEIIIIDAGSTDGTIGIIEKVSKSDKRIRYKIVQNAFPGKARNEAVMLTDASIIVQIDGGCTVNDIWLKELTTPILENNAEYVTGNVMLSRTPIQVFGINTEIDIVLNASCGWGLRDKNTVSGGASVAYKKQIWELVGGQPIAFRAGEDLLFAKKVKTLKIRTTFAGKSICFWEAGPTIKAAMNKKTRNIMFDIELNIFSKPIKRMIIRFIVLLMLVLGSFFMYHLLIVAFLTFLYFSANKLVKIILRYKNNKDRKTVKVSKIILLFVYLTIGWTLVEIKGVAMGLVKRYLNGKLFRESQKYLNENS